MFIERVATVAQFILFVSFLLKFGCGCRSESEYSDCKFKEDFNSSAVKCKYTKGNHFDWHIVPIIKSPGPARELNVSLLSNTNHFIISWNLPQDSSMFDLKGFLLRITFTLRGKEMELLRTFKIEGDFKQLEDQDISKIVLRYSCITVFPEIAYRVQLFSYPRSKETVPKETVIYTPSFDFRVNPEGTLSGEWLARIWSTTRSDGNSTDLTICFFGAPRKFLMGDYRIFLYHGKERRYTEKEIIIQVDNVTEADGKEICGTFRNLTDDTYEVELLPFGPSECRCQFVTKTHSRITCQDSCTKTLFGPIEVKTFVPDVDPPSNEWMTGTIIVVAASLLGFVLLLVAGVLLVRYYLQKIKGCIFEAHKREVLVMIMNDFGNHLFDDLTRHLRSDFISTSCFDLTGSCDDASTQSLLTSKVTKGHRRFLVVHEVAEDVDCTNLGEPDATTDRVLEKSVKKYFRRMFGGSRVCTHCLLLKSNSDAKVSILKIIGGFKESHDIHPPEMKEFTDMETIEFLRSINTASTSDDYSDHLRTQTPILTIEFDSGIGQEIVFT